MTENEFNVYGEIRTNIIRWRDELGYYNETIITKWKFIDVRKMELEVTTYFLDLPFHEGELVQGKTVSLNGNTELCEYHMKAVRERLG